MVHCWRNDDRTDFTREALRDVHTPRRCRAAGRNNGRNSETAPLAAGGMFRFVQVHRGLEVEMPPAFATFRQPPTSTIRVTSSATFGAAKIKALLDGRFRDLVCSMRAARPNAIAG